MPQHPAGRSWSQAPAFYHRPGLGPPPHLPLPTLSSSASAHKWGDPCNWIMEVQGNNEGLAGSICISLDALGCTELPGTVMERTVALMSWLWPESFKHRSEGLLALRPTDGLPLN